MKVGLFDDVEWDEFFQYVRTIKGGNFTCPVCHNEDSFYSPSAPRESMNIVLSCGSCGYIMEFDIRVARKVLEQANKDNSHKAREVSGQTKENDV